MSSLTCRIIVTIAATTGLASAVNAHTPYGMALRKHFNLRSVTCYACHMKGNDQETGKPLGKEHLNELGKSLDELLREKQITAQMEAAKTGTAADRKRVNQLATDEFLKAWKQLENETNSNQRTWREQIEAGEHEGIRLKEKP
jgi:hypothetical protein